MKWAVEKNYVRYTCHVLKKNRRLIVKPRKYMRTDSMNFELKMHAIFCTKNGINRQFNYDACSQKIPTNIRKAVESVQETDKRNADRKGRTPRVFFMFKIIRAKRYAKDGLQNKINNISRIYRTNICNRAIPPKKYILHISITADDLRRSLCRNI